MELELFEQARNNRTDMVPLAGRMRPRNIDEVLGQEHLLGPGKSLRPAIDNGRLSSFILWGPPGSGKTTLARLVAQKSGAILAKMSAVSSGVKDLRAVVAAAKDRSLLENRKTVLFIDEIHRYNKGQQDALLPHVEDGTVILIGATTENPSFELNRALLSRVHLYVLDPLNHEALRQILIRAMQDQERGLGGLNLQMDDDALELIVHSCEGDARRALNALEVAATQACQGPLDDDTGSDLDADSHTSDDGDTPKPRRITRKLAKQALASAHLAGDKKGEVHYNIVSALIKSMRGSDPDAAVYWMVRMLEAGESPRFILRRMIIFASEDVGNADPQALAVATNALTAVEMVGLPEGVLAMTQAATYLALAPKSNGALKAYAAARKDVLEHGSLPVPMKLRNAPTALMKRLGYGGGYRYPHNFEGHYVPEHYLPEALQGRHYYHPDPKAGHEEQLAARLAEIRNRLEPDKDPSDE